MALPQFPLRQSFREVVSFNIAARSMTPYRFLLSLDYSNTAVHMGCFALNHDLSGYSYHTPFLPQHWHSVWVWSAAIGFSSAEVVNYTNARGLLAVLHRLLVAAIFMLLASSLATTESREIIVVKRRVWCSLLCYPSYECMLSHYAWVEIQMKSELQPEEVALSHKLQTQSSLIYTESKCPHGGKNTKPNSTEKN